MDEEDCRRYFVVGSVILEVAQPFCGKRLEDTYTSRHFTCIQDFLNDQQVIHILFHLRNKQPRCCKDSANCVNNQILPLYKKQWDRLYTSTQQCQKKLYMCHCKYTANPILTSDLDITLAGLILLNCCNLAPPDKQAVFHIRQYKNAHLSHNTNVKLSEAEFNTLWPNLKTFILQLDPSKEDDLIRIQNRPMDGPLCNKYTTVLLEFHKRLDEIEAKLETIQENNGCKVQRCVELLEEQSAKDKIQSCRLGVDISTLHHTTDLTDKIHTECRHKIRNGVMMDDGRCVLIIRCTHLFYCHGALVIYKTDESVDSIPLQYGPWDVTTVANSTVAVTDWWGDCINMYDINSKEKVRSIQVPTSCSSKHITTINNKLVVGGFNCLFIIDPQTGIKIKTINTYIWGPCYLHAVNDKIYYCNGLLSKYSNYLFPNYCNTLLTNDKNLYCYNLSCNKISTVTLPSRYRRITSLHDGSLYVICRDGSVQHVSSDVQHYKTVATEEPGSEGECNVISYNPKQRKLIICTRKGHVRVFKEM